MAERHSIYSDQPCPYPDGFEGYGDTYWMAQNEGQKVESLALHLRTNPTHDETAEAIDE